MERCSEGIVGVGCVAIWSGRVEFNTGGIYYERAGD